MTGKARKEPSGLEKEAISRIEIWLSAYWDGKVAGSLTERAELVRGILDDYHGSNRVRLDVICPSLGCTMRSLQREFKAQYGESMHGFQERIRLARAIWYLKATPDVKMNALASEMGYDRLSEFARFFRKRTGLKPKAFLDQVVRGGGPSGNHEENP
jgi:AraC-like DNA-binding protein